ncbi:hypothetical protein Zmor_028371 [Zophobas morio]|uniref:Uncharacterized protein n=1 Tax=Zophobas morio TaxID=2755281 RepID=A0AA38M3F5_9CUCU|nr:hypothetical protein Zmor_028371 [Zophobas morio]
MPLTFLIRTIRTKKGQCYERNPYAAPVRRLWVLIYTTMVTHRGRPTFAKEKLGSGCRNGCSRTSLEAVTETFEKDRASD